MESIVTINLLTKKGENIEKYTFSCQYSHSKIYEEI